MPYTPPSQRSPAASATSSPVSSRRSSYQAAGLSQGPPPSNRPELPRSTTYLNRHRRSAALKPSAPAPAPAPASEPTPPGTSEGEKPQATSVITNGSIRQSPPPVTDGLIPKGAVISPPDSANNSSDDEDDKRGRKINSENIIELKEAIQQLEQRREGSPIRQAAEVARANQALALIMPSQMGDEVKAAVEHVERQLSPKSRRKISHCRSNTEPVALIDLVNRQSDTPIMGSDEEDESDDGLQKPPMLRKKSGELVRPALRPSSAKRRPSSMPGTPTFGKAVHFDSHLEHVRHFLQVDRPLAVSAGSSPVETYESESEFPFGEEESNGSRSPPFEWEIVVANFPAETPQRLSLPVRVERVFLSADNKTLIGSIAVQNLAFKKLVVARFTLDYWKTTSEVVAEYNNDVRRQQIADGCDRFNFSIKLADLANLEAKTMFFCVKYLVNGVEYWDNNNSTNFQIDFRKKYKLQNGKKGAQGASSRSANTLPRSNKKNSPAARPKVLPTNFDDFADGFDAKYSFSNFNQPVEDFLGDTSRGPIRLKGVKSAVTLPTDNLPRSLPKPNGQAFGKRYDFGTSLTAAMQAAQQVLGDRSGLTSNTAKNTGGKKKPTFITGGDDSPPSDGERPSAVKHSVPETTLPGTGSDSPRPIGGVQPALESQSYNELLDKYCFFGSVKSSPQIKDGTLSSRGQYDGNDDSYVLANGSGSPSPTNSRGSPNVMPSAIPKQRAPMTGGNYLAGNFGMGGLERRGQTAIRG